jgi:hypothetical protein
LVPEAALIPASDDPFGIGIAHAQTISGLNKNTRPLRLTTKSVKALRFVGAHTPDNYPAKRLWADF